MTHPTLIIKVELQSLHELAIAYKDAIEQYKRKLNDMQEETGIYSDDCWNNYIKLLHIEFEDNFRRSTMVAVFEVGEKGK